MRNDDWLTKHNWYVFQEVPKFIHQLTHCPMNAFCQDLPKEFLLQNAVFVFKKEVLYMFFVKEEFERSGKLMLGRTLKDKNYLKVILDDIENLSKKLMTKATTISGLDFSKLSDEKLYKEYYELHEIHHILWVKGQQVNLLEMGHSLLVDELELMISKTDIPKDDVNKTVNTLTSPEKYSFAQKEKQDLISTNDLTTHWKKYAWIAYDWIGPELNKDYFDSRFKELEQEEAVSEKEFSESLKIKKEEIITKYNLSEDIQELTKLIERIIFLKSLRVDATWYEYWCAEDLMKEIGKRLNLSSEQLRRIMPEEMESYLIKKQINVNKLNNRLEASAFIFREGKKTEIFEKDALAMLKELQHMTRLKEKDIQQVKGMCASHGRVKGIVRIINTPTDMNKMQEGDILVSHSTNLSLIPAMKKAAAIVAEVGGVTCHAAIVARELNKPCVIGTDIATQVFKDGDLVEVDANKGIVRKI